MSTKSELIEQIKQKAVVHGKVILSSGKEADYYVDLRRVTLDACLLYTSPSPRDGLLSRMPSSA